MKLERDTYCSYCGKIFEIFQTSYPKACIGCERESYLNAPAVGIGLIGINGGLLIVQRAIPPGIGEWALPGGYKNPDETWEEGVARETFEETGIVVDPKTISMASVRNAKNGAVLVFGWAAMITLPEPVRFSLDLGGKGAHETLAARIIHSPIETCFPAHTEMMQWWFDNHFKKAA